jgi:hypothetical protein
MAENIVTDARYHPRNDGRFDARALYEALDAQRRARGISWQEAALLPVKAGGVSRRYRRGQGRG